MLYRSLTITTFLLAAGLLWNVSPGLADSLRAQSGQPVNAEPQPRNPLLLGTPDLKSPPADVIVPIVPVGSREQPEITPGKTIVPNGSSGNSAPPAPVTDSGTNPTPPAPGFPQPSDLLPPPQVLPTPPIAIENQPTPSPLIQPQGIPSSPSTPTGDPANLNPPTTSAPPAPDSPTVAPGSDNSDALPPKLPGLQEKPGNIINFGTEPSPPSLLPEPTEPLRLEIRLSQRQVTLFRGEDVVKRYPIAVGRPGWETPKGKYQVKQMFKNPVWVSPLQKGVTIPGGDPENPLGRHWIGFWTDGKNWIGFHGTPNPRSVGTAASHGCIRMYNKDIEDLFQRVNLGIEVTVVD